MAWAGRRSVLDRAEEGGIGMIRIRKFKRPRADVLPVAAELVERLSPACERIEPVGAVRRRDRLVGEIDLLAIPKGDQAGGNALWPALDLVVGKNGYLKKGDVQRCFAWTTSPEDAVLVFVYTARLETWGPQLLFRTGPVAFWCHVLNHLEQQGYTSRDGGIWQGSALRSLPTEREVCELARVCFREPWQR